MNIVAWAVIFPVGILLSGFLSCLKQLWPGILPVGVYSLLFLCLHWSRSYEAEYLSDVFLILALASVVVYGICRLSLALIASGNKKIRNSDLNKSKVQDL